jgi:malate synthase
VEGDREVLTSEALEFLATLEHRFAETRADLLAARMRRRDTFRAGELPDFLEETRGIREGSWQVAPAPADLLNRRVEITGPVERKMMINALNSGAQILRPTSRGCPRRPGRT